MPGTDGGPGVRVAHAGRALRLRAPRRPRAPGRLPGRAEPAVAGRGAPAGSCWARCARRQLLGEVRPPAPAEPGRPARVDPEYGRNGVATCFLATEPLRGWRAATVSEQRTRLDVAACIKEVVDPPYPEAERIVLVLDQLTTHSPASLSLAFPAAEAKRLAAERPSASPTSWRSTTPPSTAAG